MCLLEQPGLVYDALLTVRLPCQWDAPSVEQHCMHVYYLPSRCSMWADVQGNAEGPMLHFTKPCDCARTLTNIQCTQPEPGIACSTSINLIAEMDSLRPTTSKWQHCDTCSAGVVHCAVSSSCRQGLHYKVPETQASQSFEPVAAPIQACLH